MIDFQYSRASDVADAVRQMAGSPSAKFIAGGLANGFFHASRAQIRESVHRPASPFDPITCSTASTMLV